MVKRASFLLIGLLAASMFAFVACDDEDTQQEANEQFCDDTAELIASLRVIRELDSDSTIEEIEEARDRARTAYENVLESSVDVVESDLQALQDAFDELQAAIDDIDEGTSIGDALDQVDNEVEAFTQEAAKILNDVDCGSVGGSESNTEE